MKTIIKQMTMKTWSNGEEVREGTPITELCHQATQKSSSQTFGPRVTLSRLTAAKQTKSTVQPLREGV